MTRQGKRRMAVRYRVKGMILRAGLFLAVTLVASMKPIPCLAKSKIAGDGERVAEAAPTKRKAGAYSGFGYRKDPIDKSRDFHKGIDIARPAGTDVRAWAGGTVVKARWMGDYGHTVDILHPDGVTTRYAHLKAIFVREGHRAQGGEVLGQVGRTGRTTGANLHFEVMVSGRQIDPRKHLDNPSRLVGG